MGVSGIGIHKAWVWHSRSIQSLNRRLSGQACSWQGEVLWEEPLEVLLPDLDHEGGSQSVQEQGVGGPVTLHLGLSLTQLGLRVKEVSVRTSELSRRSVSKYPHFWLLSLVTWTASQQWAHRVWPRDTQRSCYSLSAHWNSLAWSRGRVTPGIPGTGPQCRPQPRHWPPCRGWAGDQTRPRQWGWPLGWSDTGVRGNCGYSCGLDCHTWKGLFARCWNIRSLSLTNLVPGGQIYLKTLFGGWHW